MVSRLSSLNPEQRRRIIEQALTLFEALYVHLPLKEAMHAVRPVQRLRLLRDRAHEYRTDPQFHEELIEIFNSVRDLHTNYVLPPTFANRVAYLPFQIESYVEDGERKYALARWVADFTHETFVPGVEILRWSGVPIGRAVEICGEQHAGSNRHARHARGVEGLTIRPLALALPPDAVWVHIGYRTEAGKELETRIDWREVNVADEEEDAVAASGASLVQATTIGLDLGQDLRRRATKRLIVPDVAKRQRQRRGEQFPFPNPPSGAAGPATKGRVSGTGRQTSQPSLAKRGVPVGGARQHGFPSAAFTARDFPRRDWPVRNFSTSMLLARDFPDRGFPIRGFPVRDWPHRGSIPIVGGGSKPRGSLTAAQGRVESFLPHVFEASAVDTKKGTFGYVRIRTFSVEDEWTFVNEFIRLAALVPQNGLIIDVRGNGGGLILAGELLLQTLTPRQIEPERVQFINAPATRALIARHSGPDRPFQDFDLGAWQASAEQATQTGATYTEAFPITDPAAANLIGQQYHGPVILITDARCYSTTDILAAGFQDHGIGKIIGVDGNTGAGGANVWTHDLLRELFKGVPGSPIAALPKGIEMRVAIRRTLRTGGAAGTPVEDLGVIPDVPYEMSRRDLFDRNVDLIERAGKELAGQRAYRLDITKVANSPKARRVEVTTENLQRLDVYLGDRPTVSLDVADGTTSVTIPVEPAAATLDLRGFDDGRLAAARRALL